MKKVILTILLCVIIIGTTGCVSNNTNEKGINNKNSEEKETTKIEKYYEDDESINLLLNKYNQMYNPDITSDMLAKKHIGGRDRNDVITISNDKLEITIYGSKKHDEKYSMSVYIGYKSQIPSTNDDYKNQFVKFIKLFDESLTDEEIDYYWNDMISEYRNSYKINEIDITPNISVGGGKIEYFKMTAKIKL